MRICGAVSSEMLVSHSHLLQTFRLLTFRMLTMSIDLVHPLCSVTHKQPVIARHRPSTRHCTIVSQPYHLVTPPCLGHTPQHTSGHTQVTLTLSVISKAAERTLILRNSEVMSCSVHGGAWSACVEHGGGACGAWQHGRYLGATSVLGCPIDHLTFSQ